MMPAERSGPASRPANAYTAPGGHGPQVATSRPTFTANAGLGRQFKVLQDRGAPAQLSLFQRPAGR